ncbi:hypothetical protein K502DRAFT_366022 [Neoconidiobolus thromboides FSU 785]|nr:hypothetical protein K502DRAFT_366022 [Neoconidiobolus thromboides FSU 785]
MEDYDFLFSINYLIIALAFVVIFLNTFLIYFCFKVRPFSKDLKLIVAVASVELCAPLVTSIDYIYYFIYDIKLIKINLGCQVLGFIITSAYYYEIQLNVFLALERLCKISEIKLSKYVYMAIHLNGLGFIGLAIYNVSQHLMIPSATEIICVHPVVNSTIGFVTYYYLIFSFLFGIMIITYCYYKLARNITNRQKFVEIEINCNINRPKSNENHKFNIVFIKLYTILAIYTTCMFGSFSFHLIDSILHFVYGKVNATILIINQLGEILFLVGILANSIFFLMLHTGIANEVKKFCSNIKCCNNNNNNNSNNNNNNSNNNNNNNNNSNNNNNNNNYFYFFI